jgi:hypothetical protein
LDSFSLDTGEESLYLIIGQECYFSICNFHEVECGWVKTIDLLLFEVLEPGSYRDDVRIHCLHRESTVCEGESPGIEVFFFDVFYTRRWMFSCNIQEGRVPVLGFCSVFWREKGMDISRFLEYCLIFFKCSVYPEDKSPDMKEILLLCFTTSSFMQTQVYQKVMERGDERHIGRMYHSDKISEIIFCIMGVMHISPNPAADIIRMST